MRHHVWSRLALLAAFLLLLWSAVVLPDLLGIHVGLGWRMAGLFAGVLVLGIGYGLWTARRWRRVAEVLGLQPQTGASWLTMPDLQGQWHGTPVKLHNETRGSQQNRRQYSVMVFEADAPGPHVSLRPRRLGFGRSWLLGETLATGDPRWDHEFETRGDPGAAARLLTPGFKATVQELPESGIVAVGGGQVRHVLRNYRTDADEMRDRLDTLRRLVDEVHRAGRS